MPAAALGAGEPVDVGVPASPPIARCQADRPYAVGGRRRYVDEAVVVADDDIIETQRAIWDELRLICEPGGAAALAAVRTSAYRPAPA